MCDHEVGTLRLRRFFCLWKIKALMQQDHVRYQLYSMYVIIIIWSFLTSNPLLPSLALDPRLLN